MLCSLHMWLSLAIFMYAVWSSAFSLGKLALQYSPPLFLTGFRMLFAGVVLLAYLLVRNRGALKVGGKQWASLCLLAFFNIYLSNVLEFYGLQYLSATKACFLYGLSPFFATLFSYLHFGERINLRKAAGLLIGFFGFIPVLKLQGAPEGLHNAFGFLSWPALALIGATISSVYGWVLLRMVVREQTVSPVMASGASMLIGGLVAMGHSLFVDAWHPLPVSFAHFPAFFEGVCWMVLLSNILCYNLYGYLLRRFTATLLSFIGLLSPLFSSLHSWILLGEQPSWTILLSTGVVSFGLWLVYKVELQQGYIVKEQSDASLAP